MGLTVAQGGQWGPSVLAPCLPPDTRCGHGSPSLLSCPSLLLILASASPLHLGRVIQRVAASDPPLSLSHWELSPSPPASPSPIYKCCGPLLLGAASSEGFLASPWLVPGGCRAPTSLLSAGRAGPGRRYCSNAGDPAWGQGSSVPSRGFASMLGQHLTRGPAQPAVGMRSGLAGDVTCVMRAGYWSGHSVQQGERGWWLTVSTELEERKWLLKSLTSSSLLFQRRQEAAQLRGLG